MYHLLDSNSVSHLTFIKVLKHVVPSTKCVNPYFCKCVQLYGKNKTKSCQHWGMIISSTLEIHIQVQDGHYYNAPTKVGGANHAPT